MNFSQIEIQAAKAQNVTVTEEALTVDLTDGRTISVPLASYPRLLYGTPADAQALGIDRQRRRCSLA